MRTTSIASCCRWIAPLGMLAMLVLGSGCASLELNKNPLPKTTSWFSRNDKPKIPSRVTAVWTETTHHKEGVPPSRGFAGRLIFNRSDEEKPVKVDGTLVVYAFDEEGRDPLNPRPDRKYVFRADQLDAHYSESKLGHSYSFYLPWDELGGPQQKISLIARFQPLGAPAVAGEPTKHVLSGPVLPEAVQQADYRQAAEGRQPIQATSFESFDQRIPVSAQPQIARERQRMRTTTIDIPQRFGRQSPTARVRPRFNRTQPTVHSERAPSSSTANPTDPSQPTRPPTHSSLSRSRPLGAPIAQLTHDRVRWQPRPAVWQSPTRSTPQSASGSESN